MNGESESINIALLPSKEVTLQAIGLSKKLHDNLRTHFILNESDLLPHLTIYQAHYPKKNIEKIVHEVGEMLEGVKPFEMRMHKFDATPQGNIWWNSEALEPLSSLQKEAMKRCNELREGLMIPGIESLISLGEDYAREINNYGSLWLLDRYIPHISLTASEPSEVKSILDFLGEGERADFTASEIIVGYLGKYGTVTGIIKKFTLS